MNTNLPINRLIQSFCEIRDECKDNHGTLIPRLSMQFGIGHILLSDTKSYLNGEFTCRVDTSKKNGKISNSRFNLLMVIHFIEIENGSLQRDEVDEPRLLKMFDLCFGRLTLSQIMTFHLLSLYVNQRKSPRLAHHSD